MCPLTVVTEGKITFLKYKFCDKVTKKFNLNTARKLDSRLVSAYSSCQLGGHNVSVVVDNVNTVSA